MAYTTHSDSSPENNTSYINTGLVSLVPINPYNPSATAINWPANYDLFVNKTNDQQVSVSVSDETHAVSEIADSGLYLNHKPRRGTTINATAGAVIDSSLTDYNHGVIYFSTLPTSEFTVTYLADPDKYYGEYLTQIQDVLHKLEIWAGAGSTMNEGVRTADDLEWRERLINKKYKHKPVPYTVKTFSQEYNVGNYFVLVNKHALAINNGVIVDNGDMQFDGYRRVVTSAFQVK